MLRVNIYEVDQMKQMKEMDIESIIEAFSESEIVSQDTSIVISDASKFLYCHPSKKHNIFIPPGEDIHEKTVTYKALAQKQKTSRFVDEDVFGTPYYGTSVPIFNEGEITSVITSVLPREAMLEQNPFLTIRLEDRWIPTSFDDVIYIEAENRRTNVQTTEHFGVHQMNLRQLELLLPTQFIRSHRSFMINLNHIVEIHPDSHSTFMLVMTDGFRVPVSQTYASYFRKILHF